jgi:hypothetical protein
MFRSVLVAAAAFGLVSSASAAEAPARSAENIRAHMAFLASDLLEGRETGSRGHEIAAEYSAAQFALLGLKPAGDHGTWFQRVPLVAYRPADEGGLSVKAADGQTVALKHGEDYVSGRNPLQAQTVVSAAVVFVGYGVVAPERGRDDYQGLDVKGKIVVALDGAPKSFQTEERAYYRSSRTKRLEAEKRGAVGFVSLSTPTGEKAHPFAEGAKGWRAWSMTWRDPAGAPFAPAPGVPSLGGLSVKGAGVLFAGAPTPLEQVYAAAETEAGDPPRFELKARLQVTVNTEAKRSESRNVAALIEGSDPVLSKEAVVLSAHLDHVGVRERGEGDRIANGAIDNASGVATTFEVARAFMDSGSRPKRSILVLLVTGEEKGLVGAEYFARNPTLPLSTLTANVNLDMPILTYDFLDVVAFGAERSGVGPLVKRASERMGVSLSPDPIPEEGIFTRSDHFRFVEVGVPAVFLMTGFQNGGEAKFRDFLKNTYHKPNDDLTQAIDYAAGAKFAKLNYEIARELADAPERPRWNAGDFFASKFAQPTTIADQ